jgi:chemotaxis protein MotB
MADGEQAPIIIKKVKKGGHGGHHGGAWKVAYADFVTAMMAFFLLLWLLNATTDEQKRGIADYFTPASLSRQTSGSGGVMGGTTLSKEGALTSQRSEVGLAVSLPREESDSKAEDPQDDGGARKPDEEDIEDLLAKREEEQFAAAEEALRQAIEAVPALQAMAQNLLVDQTPEGMRIQIVIPNSCSRWSPTPSPRCRRGSPSRATPTPRPS